MGGAPAHGFPRLGTGPASLALHAGRGGDVGDVAPTYVFDVDDVEVARSHLEDHGVEVGEIRSPAPGTRVCDALEPEGNAFSVESTTTRE